MSAEQADCRSPPRLIQAPEALAAREVQRIIEPVDRATFHARVEAAADKAQRLRVPIDAGDRSHLVEDGILPQQGQLAGRPAAEAQDAHRRLAAGRPRLHSLRQPA